jgi:hypothetical protein
VGFSPENLYMRTLGGKRRADVFTANSTVIGPDVPRFWMSRAESIAQTVDVLKRELSSMVGGAVSWKP